MADDILFKSCNKSASQNQLGNKDCSTGFKKVYLETLGLGEALDFVHLDRLDKQVRVHFPGIASKLLLLAT